MWAVIYAAVLDGWGATFRLALILVLVVVFTITLRVFVG